MRKIILSVALLFPLISFGQIELLEWDLPMRGETYSQFRYSNIDKEDLPSDLFVSNTTSAQVYDFSQFDNGEKTSETYNWVEGSDFEFDFPDANMMTYDETDNSYTYFIKKPTGFYISGTAGDFETPMGNMKQALELRPALPVIQVPAKIGDEVQSESRTSFDLLTIGKVSMKISTDYKVDGYGTLKLPGGEELEVLKISRLLTTETIFDINFQGQSMSDTVVEVTGSIELYTKKYGDYVAKVDTINFNGLVTSVVTLKGGKTISSVQSTNDVELDLFPNPAQSHIMLQLSEQGSISIKTIDGKTVYYNALANNNQKIVIAHLPKGVYVVQFLSADGNSSFSKSFSKI